MKLYEATAYWDEWDSANLTWRRNRHENRFVAARNEQSAQRKAEKLFADLESRTLDRTVDELRINVTCVLGWRSEWSLSRTGRRAPKFRSEPEAKKYIEDIEAKLAAANLVADNDIWTSVEIIYETRWDCSTERLAAAGVTQ